MKACVKQSEMKNYRFLLSFIVLASCLDSASPDKPLFDDTSSTYKHKGDSHFKFTNRGIEYDARSKEKEDPANNAAILFYDAENGNKMSISALDADVSPNQSFRTGLLINIYLGQDEMKKGTYRFASEKEVIDCKARKFDGCNALCAGTIVPYTPHQDSYYDSEYTLTNALSSVSGELEITEFHLGKFSLGMAEGTISGKFFFDGYALESHQTFSGSASGKFETVKVTAQNRN